MYRIGEEELAELRRVIDSKLLFRQGNPGAGHQQEVDRFEKEWAAKIGTEYALVLSGGGTGALICALVGLGIGPGDEVIIPAYTFMATAIAVCAVGAIPLIVDVNETLSLDPDAVAKTAGASTRAVIPVHMVGRPCNLEKILEVARAKNLKVLEDCSQCDGGSYHGRRVGSWGDVGAFSFNDYKILSSGEGGAIATNNRSIYERALLYHDGGAAFRPYGQNLEVESFVGVQLRASEIMGAILRIQLQRLDGILADLRRCRTRMENELSSTPGLRLAPNNDAAGDCGVVAAFQFDTEAAARKFATGEGVGGWLPIDSGKHVYREWTPILEHRAGHHPLMNPFNHPANRELRMSYSENSCPRTLDLLARTVFISMNPDWTEQELEAKIDACRKAAG